MFYVSSRQKLKSIVLIKTVDFGDSSLRTSGIPLLLHDAIAVQLFIFTFACATWAPSHLY